MAESRSHKITVSLPEPLFQKINEMTKNLHLKKDDLIVGALTNYFEDLGETSSREEILGEMLSLIEEAKVYFDTKEDKQVFKLRLKEYGKKLLKQCKGDYGYFSQVLTLLDDVLYYNKAENMDPESLNAMTFVVEKLKSDQLTRQDAISCAETINRAGLRTLPGVEGLSQEYKEAGLL